MLLIMRSEENGRHLSFAGWNANRRAKRRVGIRAVEVGIGVVETCSVRLVQKG